jgi:hypothetical protein
MIPHLPDFRVQKFQPGRHGAILYLSVRQENSTACQFYERHGMRVVGGVAWAKGTIPGHIYFRDVGSFVG